MARPIRQRPTNDMSRIGRHPVDPIKCWRILFDRRLRLTGLECNRPAIATSSDLARRVGSRYPITGVEIRRDFAEYLPRADALLRVQRLNRHAESHFPPFVNASIPPLINTARPFLLTISLNQAHCALLQKWCSCFRNNRNDNSHLSTHTSM